MARILSKTEMPDGSIVVKVEVDRSRSRQESLDATGRKQQYVISDVVDSMPQGEGDEVEVVFFKLSGYISDDDLEKEFERRGLKPSDPVTLAGINEADPALADEVPNGTHWKDGDKWCYVTFHGWDGKKRGVGVSRCGCDWSDHWWFAGVDSQH